MNTLLLMVLPYKEQYGSFNKISLILFKIAQPTAQVLFFILVNYSNNYVDNVGNLVILNSILSSCIYSTIFAAYSLNDERLEGTLKFTIMSKKTVLQIIALRSCSSIVDGLVTMFVPIGLAFIIFGIKFTSYQLIIALACFLLGFLVAISLSLLIGSVAVVSTNLNLFMNILIFLFNFTSGAIFSLNLLPRWLKILSTFMPLNSTISLAKFLLKRQEFTINIALGYVGKELLLIFIIIILTSFTYKYFEKKSLYKGSLDFY